MLYAGRVKKIIDRKITINKIWSIGGTKGWYYANQLWKIRGFLDALTLGVGLRRGRTNISEISVGDSLDFWRVIYANKKEGRLLLFAEMKLPGEAWLEFKTVGDELFKLQHSDLQEWLGDYNGILFIRFMK